MPDYRSMFDRKYVGAWDLGGKDVTVKITAVKEENLQNRSGTNKKPVVYLAGTDKGFALNKTNASTIAAMYGNNTDEWIGRLITIYPTQTSFGPREVDAIRVRPTIPKGKAAPMPSQPMDEVMRGKQEAAAAQADADGVIHDEATNGG